MTTKWCPCCGFDMSGMTAFSCPRCPTWTYCRCGAKFCSSHEVVRCERHGRICKAGPTSNTWPPRPAPADSTGAEADSP